jgi:hypothetical protein
MGLKQNVEALATKITEEFIKATCISLTILFQNKDIYKYSRNIKIPSTAIVPSTRNSLSESEDLHFRFHTIPVLSNYLQTFSD